MNKEVIGYYQSNMKTSRNEDSVYAMKYASQQMLINKLEQENQQLHNKIDKIRELVDNSDWRLDDVHDLIDGYNEIEEILKDSDVDEE